ncbi:DUF3014 domain-containing protein [Colwellia sp. MEBiC06753]
MTNPEPSDTQQTPSLGDTQVITPNESKDNKIIIWSIVAVVVVAIVLPIYYYLSVEKPVKEVTLPKPAPAPVTEPIAEPEEVVVAEPLPELEVVNEAPESEVLEPVPEPEIVIPSLNESDDWIKQQLSELTWRKELLRLVIDDDMVRRLVVFTDNFAQGLISYEYSPLVKPSSKFSAIKPDAQTAEANQWQWDEAQTKRFTLYVDFLRSFEPERLANWYFELKPLIDQAYGELGYAEQDFTDVLQEAVNKVLDMEIPKDDMVLVRPSVMYKFADPNLESLPDTDKFLLRVGKDNLLVIKSFLLEFSDALARAEANR